MENKLRILAVDDSMVSLAAIEQGLADEYEVITVNSGMRAIRFLRQERPDLILLDIQMVQKDGIETLRDIRAMENGADIPVIMLTSKKDKDAVIKSHHLGAHDYVLKPFDMQDLQVRIRRTLKKTGSIPVKDKELYGDIKEVQEELLDGNTRAAIAKANAILNYKTDPEMLIRMQNIHRKLLAYDKDTANRMVGRALKLLERNLEPTKPSNFASAEMIKAWLFCAGCDLGNFNVRGASQKLEDLLRFDLPPAVGNACKAALLHLEEYDDGAAEELVKETLQTFS